MIRLEFTGRCTADFDPLFERNAFPEDFASSVNEILCDIRKRGDHAICDYAKKFDGVELSAGQFQVSPEELDAADAKVDQDVQ